MEKGSAAGRRGEIGEGCDWTWVREAVESQIMLVLNGHGQDKEFEFHTETGSH